MLVPCLVPRPRSRPCSGSKWAWSSSGMQARASSPTAHVDAARFHCPLVGQHRVEGHALITNHLAFTATFMWVFCFLPLDLPLRGGTIPGVGVARPTQNPLFGGVTLE